MKRFVLAVLVLAIAGATGLAGWSRARVHQEYRGLLQALATRPEVRLLESRLDAGWWTAHAELAFELQGAAGALYQRRMTAAGAENVRSRLGFRSDHRIDHGVLPLWRWLWGGAEGAPVIAEIHSRVALDPETRAELLPVTGAWPALQAETILRAGAPGELQLTLPPGRLEPRPAEDGPSGMRTVWRGLQGSVAFAADGEALAGELVSPGLVGEGETRNLALEDLSLHFDVRRDASGLWVGSVSQELGSLSFATEEQGVVLALSGLSVEQSSAVAAGSLRSATKIALGGLQLGANRVGPGAAEWELRQVDAAALATWEGADDERAPWTALLSRSPVLEVSRLELDTPEGPLRARGRVVLDAARAEALASPLTAPAAVEAQLEIEGPQASFAAALPAESLARLQAQGLLVPDGDRLRAVIELREGALTANGAPVAWPAEAAGPLADASPRPRPTLP